MDLNNIPVIDNHMHIIPPRNSYRTFSLNISAYPTAEKHLKSMIAYRMLIARLAVRFGMEGTGEDEVMAERNRRFDADPTGYIHSLMEDAGIKTLICDIDAPISAYWNGNYRTDHDVEEFIRYMEPEIKIERIIRIEIAANLLLKEELPFEVFLEKWRANMLVQAKKFDIIAIKSVIAYFTGLAVTNPTKEEGQTAYETFLADRTNRGAEKTWRDFMLHRGLELCHELGLPMQIHTGYGDVPYGDLRVLNPILLIDFLNEELCRKVPIVLLHGGYPYCREIGILASQYPQVYLDFSEFIPNAGYAVESCFPMIMETAPYTKVLFGSDAGGVPETLWLAVAYAKKAVGNFLDQMIERKNLTEADALDFANAVFWRNATEVYTRLNNHPAVPGCGGL